MKKNTLQKVVAVALTGAMAMGTLTGCGSNNEPATTSSAAESSSAATSTAAESSAAASTEEATAAGMDSWTAFDSNVNLRVAVYDRGTEGIDPVTENGYTKYVQAEFGDKYNVTLEFVPITRSDVMTSYSLLAASKKLPTILMEYDYPKVTQWANDGYLQSIDLDAFKQVAPTYYNRMEELGQLNYTKVNGDDFFAFAKRPFYATTYTYVTMVRMDWLEQIGYDHVPADYAEYCDVMDKLIAEGIAKHPAGGTKKAGASDFQNYGFRDYPVNETEWAMHSSLGTAAFSWEPSKAMFKRANAEYNKGYTNPEYYITDGETAKAAFINGETYAYAGYMSASVDWLEAFYAANPDAKLAIASSNQGNEPGVMDFAQMRSNNPYGMTIGFGNSATEDELTAAWMYMEWCTQPEVLYELQHNDWNNFNNSKDFWCVTIEAVEEDTIEATIAACAPQGLPQDFTQMLTDNYYELQAIADAGHAYTDPQYAVAFESESEYSASLLSLAIEYYDKLVQCKPEEFDAMYDQFSADYLKAGYQAIIDERKAAYEAGNSTTLPF